LICRRRFALGGALNHCLLQTAAKLDTVVAPCCCSFVAGQAVTACESAPGCGRGRARFMGEVRQMERVVRLLLSRVEWIA
jgi:hypothetical protein